MRQMTKKSEAIAEKIIELSTLIHKLSVWRFKGSKIVFTNGCFDVLHHGHVYLLNQAAEIDHPVILVVGLNSDDSVKQLKGENRPVNNFNDRALLLSNLYVVDYVVGFNELTPIELIKMIQPEYLVKGGDYKEDEIVGAEIVKSYGGKVAVIPFLENYSSTSVIERLGRGGKK